MWERKSPHPPNCCYSQIQPLSCWQSGWQDGLESLLSPSLEWTAWLLVQTDQPLLPCCRVDLTPDFRRDLNRRCWRHGQGRWRRDLRDEPGVEPSCGQCHRLRRKYETPVQCTKERFRLFSKGASNSKRVRARGRGREAGAEREGLDWGFGGVGG